MKASDTSMPATTAKQKKATTRAKHGIGKAEKTDIMVVNRWNLYPGFLAGATHRWWIYQKERFPLVGHGLLIAAFSFSAVSYSFLLRGEGGFPAGGAALAAFLTVFTLFLQLRIADEFKDFEEDLKYRPYRPVQRGLVTLGELRAVAMGAGLVQLVVVLLWAPLLAFLLLVIWLYLGLMTREFFVRDWIIARPVTYLWTHMLIIPLADLFATACDWIGAGEGAPTGLFWFITASFFNGIILEVGRKIRAPAQEEHGVKTYSKLWGRKNAVMVWLGGVAMSAVCCFCASNKIHFGSFVGVWILGLSIFALVLGWRFYSHPVSPSAKHLEHFSGIWTILMYLNLGVVPLLWKYVQHMKIL